MSGFEALGSSQLYRSFPTVAADIDCGTYNDEGMPARWVRIGTGGDLVVEGLDGVEVTIVGLLAGEVHLGGVRVIKAATTAGDLTVYW